MRLSAVVDELTQRLRKMSDAKVTAETQLARTGHLGAKDIFSAEEESNLPQLTLLYICQLLLSYR